jgi:predicted phage terminase large subunit-like protein
MAEKIEIRPQRGQQEAFLSSPADIAIFGGSAGGGKTMALLIEPLRHMDNPDFGSVTFRRNMTDITKEGGLWDASHKVYNLIGGRPLKPPIARWEWPEGGRFTFAHLSDDSTVYNWMGSEIPLICFDEMTHFTKAQILYMMSRNRSTCGVRPYIRGTCNPDPDSFVAELVEWYIDQDTGYAIKERSGVIRYFLRDTETDSLVWAASKQELLDKYPKFDAAWIKSFTFIRSSVYDNKILLEKDPGYLGNLMALPLVERERLLGGNWKIRPAAGLYFQRHYFDIVSHRPTAVKKRVRHWDLAATDKLLKQDEGSNDPDFTVGLLLSEGTDGFWYVEHVERFQGNPNKVESAIMNTAKLDGRGVVISLPQDPGQAGKAQAEHLTRMLAGWNVEVERETGSKITRAGAVSAQAERGRIRVVAGKWVEAFMNELENFPRKGAKDDQVDALSGAFNYLTGSGIFHIGG